MKKFKPNRNMLLMALIVGALMAVTAFGFFTPTTDPSKLPAGISAGQPTQSSTEEEIGFPGLVDLVKTHPGTIRELVFVKNQLGQVDHIEISFNNGRKAAAVSVPTQGAAERVLSDAIEKGIQVAGSQPAAAPQEPGWGLPFGMPGWLFPTLLSVLFFYWIYRMSKRNPLTQQQQHEQLKRSGAGKVQPETVKVTFADVAGCEEAKRLLARTVRYLKNPEQVALFGGKQRKGILLTGDPGNGKTLLAKAVAGEAKAVFFNISASQFVEMFVGLGAARVRDLFNETRKEKPAIIFIDEIDAVGRQRGTGIGNTNDERESTLNQLLVEMDGFVANEGMVIIAATNRADVLDPALLRPGRFDLQISIDTPDHAARVSILKVHVRNKPLSNEVDLTVVASNTPGMSGAQLEGVCNEAAHVADERRENHIAKLVAEGKEQKEAYALVPVVITMADFDEGITRIQMGLASDKVMTEDQKRNTAVHELGHAFVSYWRYLTGQGGDPISKITIIGRARALGYTIALPNGDRYNYTQAELESRIMMALGGRTAQQILLDTIDTGATNDFEQAKNLAYQMVTRFGMSQLGMIFCGEPGPAPFLGRAMSGVGHPTSPDLANKIDSEWQRIIAECTKETEDIISKNRSCFEHMVNVLMKQETILGPQWDELFNSSTCAVKARTYKKNVRMGDSKEPGSPEACCSMEPDASHDLSLAGGNDLFGTVDHDSVTSVKPTSGITGSALASSKAEPRARGRFGLGALVPALAAVAFIVGRWRSNTSKKPGRQS